MLLQIGKKYLLMTQRYAWHGTVTAQNPTHVQLGDDAEVEYEDIGAFHDWASGKKTGSGNHVPGQVVCMLGTDATPLPASKSKKDR